MRIKYSQDAKYDIQRLWQFIAIKTPSAATRIINELAGQLEMLADFPNLGFPVESDYFAEDIRELIVQDYVVIYALSKDVVQILRIWHGKEKERTETINEDSEAYIATK